MRCIKCGALLKDENAIFCEKCYKEAKMESNGAGKNELNEKAPDNKKSNNNKKPKNKKKAIIITVISVVLVLAMLVGAFFIWFYSTTGNMKGDDLTSDLGIASGNDLPFTDKVKNIALFGLDSRANDINGRSDAIIILSIDRINKEVKLTSIARDTYIQYENGKHDKITHAWYYGKADLAVKTLNKNFNLDITDYVTTNFFQFAEIIDYIGGVTIDVNKSEMRVMNTKYIPYINDLGIKCDYIKEPGIQHLNGGQALAYSRDRYTGSDMERGGRQREVLTAMFDKVKKINPLKYPKLANMIFEDCTTSLSSNEMLSIGMWAMTSAPKLRTMGLPNDECKGHGQMINGTSYMVYDLDLATKVIHDFIYNPEKEESSNIEATSSK